MNTATAGGVDPYGGFPINCPNGSGYSIRLGNDLGGGQAEGISYEFTIPANQNTYSLIYHYAVVFQDPNHQEFQQPRLELEITNVSDGTRIDCSSFTFIPYGSLLPGFFLSPNPVDTTPVWCKDWSAVSINLNGHAGKTIRLFFKTADCTFTRHFGYAYIDVNSECSSEFVGATYCPDDTTVIVTAPYGYQSYTWYNNGFSQIIGNQQTITFTPPPPVGTTIAVEVFPFNGYGCQDTLFALLIDTLTVFANAGRDTLYCNENPVPIGVNPKPGFVYSWSPVTGLSNPTVANPLASPPVTTTYVVTTSSQGGGCATTDSVIVTAPFINNSIQLQGKDTYCVNSGDSSVLFVQAADSIQWYRNNSPIFGANQTVFKVIQSGSYHARLYDNVGCSLNTAPKVIFIDIPRPGIQYPLQYAVINYPLTLQARTFGSEVLWMPSTYLNDPSNFNPVFRGATDQLYHIEITTSSGCVTIDTQLVKTVKEVKIYVPTAFTPDNNGVNDYLRPILMGVKELVFFRVYNRWGQLIFDLKSDHRGWDGTIGGRAQSVQTVVWMAKAIGVDNRVYTDKGTSIILR